MIATWMLYGILVALLAAVSAAALEGASRLLGRAGRWWWVAAMLATLLLPVAAWMRPVHFAPAVAPPTGAESTVDRSGLVPVRIPIVGAPGIRPFDWSVLDRPLAFGWAFCSLALIGWFGVGALRLRRMRRSWKLQGDLLVSQAVGPAVVGFFRCRVVVPEWSLALGVEQRELLLAHEAEHLAAYDSRLLWSAAALLALVPWNPGFWWQFRRLRLAIELDCDQRVLQKRPDTATYGRLLLEVGARVTRTNLPVTAFYEPMSSLERRIRSMTATRPKGAAAFAAMSVLGAAAAMFLAFAAPHPTVPARSEPAVQADSFMSQRWLHEVLAKFFGEVLERPGDGRGPRLWFLADSSHNVLAKALEEAPEHATVAEGDLQRRFPELPDHTVTGMRTGAVTGFPRKDAQLVWVTVGNPQVVREWAERREGASGEARERREKEEHEARSESNPAEEENAHRLREAAAKYYPQYLKTRADPPVVLWFLEGPEGSIAKHVQTPRGGGEGVGDVPQELVGPGHFDGSISVAGISGDRSDVTLVWVRPNKAR